MKKSRALAVAAAAVIVIIAAIAWWETRPVPVTAALPGAETAGVATPAAADDRVLGNPNAPITIVEYASLTCRIAPPSTAR